MALDEIKLMYFALNEAVSNLTDPVDSGVLDQLRQDTLIAEAALNDYEPPGPVAQIIVDNTGDTESIGVWKGSSGANPIGNGSVYNNAGGTFTWRFTVAVAGDYPVYAHWTYHSNRSSTVPYYVNHADGQTQVIVNQRNLSLGGQWNLLGTFPFLAGDYSIVVSSENGQACADAVRIDIDGEVESPPVTDWQVIEDFPAATQWINNTPAGASITVMQINGMGRIAGVAGSAPVLAVNKGLVGPYGFPVWRYEGEGRGGWRAFTSEPYTQDVVEWAIKPRWTPADFDLFVSEMEQTGYVTGFNYATTTPVKRKNNYAFAPVTQSGYKIANGAAGPRKIVVIVCKLHPQEDQGMDMAAAITHTLLATPSLLDGMDFYVYFGNPGGTAYDHHRGTTDAVSRNANRVWGQGSSVEVDALTDDLQSRLPSIDAFFDLHGFAIKNPVTEPYGYYALGGATASANDAFLGSMNERLSSNLAYWGSTSFGWAITWAAQNYSPAISMLLESADALPGYPDVMPAHSAWADAVISSLIELNAAGSL